MQALLELIITQAIDQLMALDEWEPCELVGNYM